MNQNLEHLKFDLSEVNAYLGGQCSIGEISATRATGASGKVRCQIIKPNGQSVFLSLKPNEKVRLEKFQAATLTPRPESLPPLTALDKSRAEAEFGECEIVAVRPRGAAMQDQGLWPVWVLAADGRKRHCTLPLKAASSTAPIKTVASSPAPASSPTADPVDLDTLFRAAAVVNHIHSIAPQQKHFYAEFVHQRNATQRAAVMSEALAKNPLPGGDVGGKLHHIKVLLASIAPKATLEDFINRHDFAGAWAAFPHLRKEFVSPESFAAFHRYTRAGHAIQATQSEAAREKWFNTNVEQTGVNSFRVKAPDYGAKIQAAEAALETRTVQVGPNAYQLKPKS